MKPTSSSQSSRLFKNPVLEALTHVHPSVPFIVWIPIVLYFLYFTATQTESTPGFIALYFVLGTLFWTITEYGMHRYVFHFPATSKAGKYLVFLFHGIHHDEPNDATRLVMPPVVSLVLGSAFYYLFKFALGPVNAMPFFSGFISGYLVYDYMHFAIHHFRPRTEFGKKIKKHHMEHHFLEKGGKWGVSNTLWDHVFGTMK
jgi:sterol desaturase/sphingolipid hydroxylase (fatty acid hydroxylase superfamily)